ncbi:MAG: hypothetical protein ACI9KE_000664 [Polyangiales bacterium]|jgi:hypothetical protein
MEAALFGKSASAIITRSKMKMATYAQRVPVIRLSFVASGSWSFVVFAMGDGDANSVPNGGVMAEA